MATTDDAEKSSRDWSGMAGTAVDVMNNVSTVAKVAGGAGVGAAAAVAGSLIASDQNLFIALVVGGLLAVPGAVVVQFGRTVDSLMHLPDSAKQVIAKPVVETRLPGRFGRLVGLTRGMRRVGKLGLDSKEAVLAVSPPFLLAAVGSSLALPLVHFLGLVAIIVLVFFR